MFWKCNPVMDSRSQSTLQSVIVVGSHTFVLIAAMKYMTKFPVSIYSYVGSALFVSMLSSLMMLFALDGILDANEEKDFTLMKYHNPELAKS